MRDRGRARQVARLFSDGVSRESICEATGLTYGTVSAYVSYARREGLLEPVRGHVTLTARLHHDHAEALRREAERRGCEVNELTARLLGLVCGDGLFDAVLGTPEEERNEQQARVRG